MTSHTPKYLDPAHVIAKRQTEPPRNPSRTGYGPKIGTSWELMLTDKRWHRVYVMQWSNLGTPYVIVKGENLLLGTYDPSYEPRRGGGGAHAGSKRSAKERYNRAYSAIFRKAVRAVDDIRFKGDVAAFADEALVHLQESEIARDYEATQRALKAARARLVRYLDGRSQHDKAAAGSAIAFIDEMLAF